MPSAPIRHGSCVAIYDIGDDNRIGDIVLKDLVNTGNTNDISPQGLVLSSTATRNSFPKVYGNNVRSVVVDNSSGDNMFGELHAVDCKDNGFCGVGSGAHGSLGALFYDGEDSALGLRHDYNITIGAVHVLHAGAACVFFGACGDVDIESIFVREGNEQNILYLNEADTGHIRIGSLKGYTHNTIPIFMPSGTGFGDVLSLSIDNFDILATFDSSNAVSTFSFIRLEAVHGLTIGRAKVDVILLGGYSPTNPFYVRISDTLDYPSRIDSFRIAVFEADGVTEYTTATCRIVGFDGSSNQPLPQSLLRIGEGVIDTSGYLRPYMYSKYQPNRLAASAVPTVGAFRVGDVLWNETPGVGLIGWICTAAGSPGTWIKFAATYDGSYTPTLFNTTNLDSSTASTTYYFVNNDRVHVFGSVAADATAAANTATRLGVSLPIPTDLSSFRQLSGSGVINTGSARLVVQIIGDATNDRAQFDWYSANTASADITFEFSYRL